VEHSVERELAEETEVLEDLLQRHFAHHKAWAVARLTLPGYLMDRVCGWEPG
jgi:hypothetical protein